MGMVLFLSPLYRICRFFFSKIHSFEAGVSYAFASNTELNVFYKNVNYKDLGVSNVSGKYDLKVDGLGVGVTFKF